MAILLNIGEKFPEFKKKIVLSHDEKNIITNFSSEDLMNKHEWTVMFWWPKDFSGLCPTELIDFNTHYNEFISRKTFLIGASTDSEYVHQAWKKYNPQLTNIKYPILADTSKSLADDLGILHDVEKVAYRATYILDPQGIIRWISINDLSIGRNVNEVIRVLSALQTGGFCPSNWQIGDPTL